MTAPLRAGPDHEERRTPVVAHEGSGPSPVLPRSVLTRRERQVVAAVATGLMDKEVAYQLAISPRTVKVHMSAILRKTGCDNRLQLTRWWLGLIDDGLCPATLARCSLPSGHDGEHRAVFG